jgi:hypothetical protein
MPTMTIINPSTDKNNAARFMGVIACNIERNCSSSKLELRALATRYIHHIRVASPSNVITVPMGIKISITFSKLYVVEVIALIHVGKRKAYCVFSHVFVSVASTLLKGSSTNV